MDWLVESLLKLAKLDAGTARFCPETISLSALLARAAEPFAIGMELRGQQPVSYTHLDVYKRQVL